MDFVTNRNVAPAMLGLITAVAAAELENRIRNYENGTLVKDTDEMLRDLKAAVNSMIMLNEALLNEIEKN